MSRKKYPRIKDYSEIGQRIKFIRGNLAQKDFGELFGVNQNTVSRWERGQVLSDEETLKRIAACGGVTYRWILYGDEPLPTQLEDAAAAYERRPAELEVPQLAHALFLAREFLQYDRRKLSDQGEAQLAAYIYEYLDSERRDPGEVVIRRLADLIKKQEG